MALFKQLAALWEHIDKRQRVQLFFLLLLTLIVASVEMISVGAVFPFIAALIAPQNILANPLGHWLASVLDITDARSMLLPVTIIFVLAAIFAGSARLFLVWVQTKVSYLIGHELAVDVYRQTLYLPYITHTQFNSSDAINSVYSKASGISSAIILPIMTIISSIILAIAILMMLIALDPILSLAAVAGFSLIYVTIAKLTHKRLIKNSRLVASEAGRVIRSIQEGLGGIRDVLLDRTQEIYCEFFKSVDLSMRKAQIDSALIAQSPRFGIESLGLVLIAILAYMCADDDGDVMGALPLLAGLALGAQRLLPLLQQTFQAWSSIKANQASLEDSLLLLDRFKPETIDSVNKNAVIYKRSLSLKNIWFRYRCSDPWVLKGVSLEIIKGAKVGFFGATGCGKSTLLDIVMGLLKPSIGELNVDGVLLDDSRLADWQKRIAHVPQSIFLADSSITRNIALGVPLNEIDMVRVVEAARCAQLLETINSWPDRFDTIVGERGICLSGGQRQRIGIARALYKHADILIFDEATSALDTKTESNLMDAISCLGSGITILMIAHRLNTLSNCDLVVELHNGRIIRQGMYKEMVNNKEEL